MKDNVLIKLKNRLNKDIQSFWFDSIFINNNDKFIIDFINFIKEHIKEYPYSEEDNKLFTKYLLRYFPKVYLQTKNIINNVSSKLLNLNYEDFQNFKEYIACSNYIKNNLD